MKGVGIEVFLVLGCVTYISGYIPCPETHVERDGKCCRPTICSIYEGFSPCKSGTAENPGLDTCYTCLDGQLSGEIINTKDFPEEYDLCHTPDCQCPPEAEIVNFKECTTTGARKLCRCAVSKGFYGSDANVCKRVDPPKMAQMQRKGYELLLTGEVRECQEGFYKEKSDSSSCLPHKKCLPGYKVKSLGSKVKDTECMLAVSTTLESEDHVKSSTPPLKDLTLPGNSSTDEGGGPTSSDDDNILSLSIASPVSLVVFVVVGGFAVYMYRKRKTSNNRKQSDLESDSETGDSNSQEVCSPLLTNEDESAGLPHASSQQPYNSSLINSSQANTGQNDPTIPPPTSLAGTQPSNNSSSRLPEPQSRNPSLLSPEQQPTDSNSAYVEEDHVSLTANAVDFSILDEKTEKHTEKPIGRVIPQKTEIKNDEDQILASPEQEDHGELYIGGQSMNPGFEVVQLSPLGHQPQNGEDETISKEL